MVVEYVMVPVPVEHAEELQQEILKMSIRDSMGTWEPDVLASLYGELSDRERTLVDLLVEAALAGHRLIRETVTEGLRADRAEVDALVDRINTRAHQRAQKWLIMVGPGPVDQPDTQVLAVTQASAEALSEHLSPTDPGT